MKYIKNYVRLFAFILVAILILPNSALAQSDSEGFVKFENFKMNDSDMQYIYPGITNYGFGELINVYVNRTGKFAFDIKATNLDETKNYTVSLKSDFLNTSKKFTGVELNEGATITIDDAKSTVTVSIIEEGMNKPISYKYQLDCTNMSGNCDSTPKYLTTIKIYFDDSRDYTELDAVYKKLAPNGKIRLNSIDLRDKFNESAISAALQEYVVDGYSITGSCYEKCNIYIQSQSEQDKSNAYDVEYEFITPNDKVKAKVQEYAKKFVFSWQEMTENIEKMFIVEDLENINYKYNTLKNRDEIQSLNSIVNYSSAIHKMVDNDNINFIFDIRAGDDGDFAKGTIGPMNLLYDGIIYENVDLVGFVQRDVIYVPDETEKTREAFISAAKTRIEEYLKNVKVEITYGGLIADINESELMYPFEQIVDVSKTTGEWYIISLDGNEFQFIIAAASKKMNTPFMYTKDASTDIYITTYSYDAPLDSKIKANILDVNSNEYKELLKKLNIENGISVDLKLYSDSLGTYITKLENGNFKVYIPIDSSYNNKKLIAYYLKDDGTKEEHTVTIENGYASFETDHFSTYTLLKLQLIILKQEII